jgi:hypothetical protein
VTFTQGLDRLATPTIEEPDGLNWHYRQGSAVQPVLAADTRAMDFRNGDVTRAACWTGACSAALINHDVCVRDQSVPKTRRTVALWVGWASAGGTTFAVWGGMTARQRRALLKRRPAVLSWVRRSALFEADRRRLQFHAS